MQSYGIHYVLVTASASTLWKAIASACRCWLGGISKQVSVA